MAERKLTPKQARFVEEYLVDLNATQAAIRAGYSQRTADRIGPELLGKPWVAAAVRKALDKRSKRMEITVDRVLQEVASMAFFDPADLAAIDAVSGPQDIPNLPEHVRRAIVGWGWDRGGNFTLKLAPKATALDLLGRHLGMWNDKLDVNVGGLAERLAAARKRAVAKE